MIQLEPGDIFAVAGQGLIGKLCRNLMSPYTTRFHFGLVIGRLGDLCKDLGMEIPVENVLELLDLPHSTTEDDYIILESINKGIAPGYLSFYRGTDIKFYRPNRPVDRRRLAALAFIKYGRSSYGYLQVFKIMIQGFWLLFKHIVTEGTLRPIYPWELSWSRNTGALICTRGVDLSYDVAQASIIPDEFCPVPAAYKWAEIMEEVSEIDFKL